jgi:hypothetical protein
MKGILLHGGPWNKTETINTYRPREIPSNPTPNLVKQGINETLNYF